MLNTPDGFHYVPDCRGIVSRSDPVGAPGHSIHYGGDFSDSSIDGTVDGFGESSADAGGCGIGE